MKKIFLISAISIGLIFSATAQKKNHSEHNSNSNRNSHTSNKSSQTFNINVRAVYSMRACGQGYTGLGCHRRNQKRVRASQYDSSEPTKNRRRLRRGKAKQKSDKNKATEGTTYKSGSF